MTDEPKYSDFDDPNIPTFGVTQVILRENENGFLRAYPIEKEQK